MADGTETKKTKTSKATAEKPASAKKKTAAGASAPEAQTKFAQFLASQKLDPRRLLSASRKLEGLQPEDRLIKLKKRQGRKAEGDAQATKETRKPRSGRPVTPRALDAAMKGGKMSGPTKTRLLKVVNHLLSLKKQEAVQLRSLF